MMVQRAAIACNDSVDYYASTWVKAKKTVKRLVDELTVIGLYAEPSATNFVYIRTSRAEAIFYHLWKNKISVFPSWDSEFIDADRDGLRIVAGLPDENIALLKALKTM
ncbi:MAG: hypothetical protein HY364_00690 [Candidatus Aenigmarchaeota archaeon]|nr:hypothetical protein [Candidatus Aenigmarchaeota archaeon]